MTPAEAGAALAAEAARLAARGWMPATSGNLSVVLGREPLRLAVTASGRDKGELAASDVVVVDAAGAPAPEVGAQPVPSAEAALHARIAALTGAGAVLHVHTVAAVAAAARHPAGVELEGLEMLKALGRAAAGEVVRVPVVANSQDMVELGDLVEGAYEPGTPAVLVAGHGLTAWGRDLRQARHHLEAVQWLLEAALALP